MTSFSVNDLFSLLIIVGLFILYFLIKNLLPSYFSEKGKNLATKEDITDITRLVEGVKQTFTTETEHLKANLQMLTNLQVGLASEERNSIIDYNEKYFRWLNALTDSSFGNADSSDNNKLDLQRNRIGEYYLDFLNSETRFNLFVADSNLSACSNKMKIKTLEKLGSLATNCLLNLQRNNNDIDFVNKNTPIEEQREKKKQLLDEKVMIHKDFCDSMILGYKDIVLLNKTFQEMCRNHIYQLLTKQDEENITQ